MHLDDGQIQGLLHGELAPGEDGTLRRHVSECAHCRQQLDDAEREEARIFGLLRRVDHPVPPIRAEAVAERAQVERPVWGRWAAGILLALGAFGAAYAAPGSPLRRWVADISTWIASPAQQATPSIKTPPGTAGVAVSPGPHFTIRFAGERPGALAQVLLTNKPNVVVRAQKGAATFTTEADRLVIESGDSAAEYEIELPLDAPWVEIRVGQQRLLLKQGSHFITDAPADDRGRYLLQLTPSKP